MAAFARTGSIISAILATRRRGHEPNPLAVYVIALSAINLVWVLLQCGFGECHTFGYRLLE